MIEYVFAPGTSNELTLDDSDIVRHNPVKTHTGKADLTATLKANSNLEQYGKRQDRLNIRINGSVEWTGYLIGVDHNVGRGETHLTGIGIEKRLEETRPDYANLSNNELTYTNISLEDALSDYWPRTPFTSASVTSQSTETVANDTELQSADTTSEWNSITTLDNTIPVGVNSGNLELLQVAHTEEGENASGSYTSQEATAAMSGGDCATVAFSDEFIEYSFTPQIDIPASDVGLYLRHYAPTESPQIDMSLNGTSWTAVVDGATLAGLDWEDFTSYSAGTGQTYISAGGGDLSAGTTYTWRIDAQTDTSTSAGFAVDVIAPLHTGYSYTFDNNNGGSSGYLDGPELYPSSYSFELDTAKTNYNITQANITSSWNDTTNNQSIAVSNDGGASYTSSTNTTSLTANFTGAGRNARSRFTLSRYGSRTTATPQTGYLGQSVASYTLTVDLNDLVVIDELTLSRNHFDNLRKLHQYGGFVYVVEHSDDTLANMTVSSFKRGDETRTSPSVLENPIDKNPEVQTETYHNSVYLQGALQDDGSRPIAEVKDQTRINQDGREIQAFVRDHTISTEDGAVFRANALLQRMLDENDLTGSITTPPGFSHPGYSYLVDFGEGEKYKTAEEVSLTQSNGESRSVYRFKIDPTFARELESLKDNATDVGDEV